MGRVLNWALVAIILLSVLGGTSGLGFWGAVVYLSIPLFLIWTIIQLFRLLRMIILGIGVAVFMLAVWLFTFIPRVF